MYEFYKNFIFLSNILFSNKNIFLNKYLHPFSKNLILLKKFYSVKKFIL